SPSAVRRDLCSNVTRGPPSATSHDRGLPRAGTYIRCTACASAALHGSTPHARYPIPCERSPASSHPRCKACRSCSLLPFLDLSQRGPNLDVDREGRGGLVAGVLHLVADELHGFGQHLLPDFAHERV